MRRVPLAVLAACCLSVAAAAMAAEPTATDKEVSSGDGVIVRASVDWLANALPGGNEATTARYTGKTLLVDGWIEEMGRDRRGWYVALRRFSARPTATRCYFADGGDQLDSVYVGKNVEATGTCQGYDRDIDCVVLTDCRIVIDDYAPEDGQ